MGPEQWLFLQWHEHKGSLISTFEKLFERNTFVDCTLAAEGQYLNVHKVILSACSPYFEILLNENRDKHPIIILKDVKFRSLKSIIEYMYRGEANVLSTEIKDFLSAAETLQIKGLGKQGGGDTKNTPPKELRDFVEAESLTTGSQEISHDSGEKEMWRNPDLASVLSETSCESANQNNTVFSQGDHLSTKKIAPQRITVPVMRVEEEKEIKWPKMEGNDEPRKCLKAVMPTLNLGSHAMEPVHHATVDKVLDLNVCNTSLQSVPSTNDAQMSMELTRKNELEPEPQQALGTRETEEVETASVASSAIEVSDTTEEWAEEDIEEGPTPSQATGHSAPADESHPLFDASNMTRDSVSRNIANDHQGRRKKQKKRHNESRKKAMLVEKAVSTGASSAITVTERISSVPKLTEPNVPAQKRVCFRRLQRRNCCQEVTRAQNPCPKKQAKSHEDDYQEENETEFLNASSNLKSALRVIESHIDRRPAGLKPIGKCLATAPPGALRPAVGPWEPCPRQPVRKNYVCPICRKAYPWLCHLKSHMETHKCEPLYKCDECAYVSTKFSDYVTHQRLHFWRSTQAPVNQARVREYKRFKSAERTYKCTMFDFSPSLTDREYILANVERAQFRYEYPDLDYALIRRSNSYHEI